MSTFLKTCCSLNLILYQSVDQTRLGVVRASIPLFGVRNLSLAGQFKVSRVPDGDTVNTVGHGIEIKVRLVVRDAHEPFKPKGSPDSLIVLSLKITLPAWFLTRRSILRDLVRIGTEEGSS